MPRATIFVTGAESFVGRALRDACTAADIRFTGIDLAESTQPDVVRGDIGDPDLAKLIPANVDAVVHLAALSRDADCRGRLTECIDVNVRGTLNVRAAARIRGARQFIFASSEWVYGNGPFDTARTEDNPIDLASLASEYALSKAIAEAVLRQDTATQGGNTTILRFGIIYGPRGTNWSAVEALAHTVATAEKVSVGALSTARRFIHVADIADAILATLGRSGLETFNVQGPALTSLGDVIAAACVHTRRSPAVTETSPDTPSIRNIDATRFTEATGWVPRIGLIDGIASLGPAILARAA